MESIIKLSVLISIFIILLSSDFIDAQATASKVERRLKELKRFNYTQDGLILTNNAAKNFNRALNLVTNNTEFHPLSISIGSFGFRNNILDRVAKYLTLHTANYYRFDLNELDKRELNLQPGLTWIIVVDDYNILESHVRGHANFWRAAKQFIIIYVGKKMNKPSNHWQDIFKILWNLHRVCKVLITSFDENFRCLYRYMPFDKVNEEYGSVQLLEVEDTSSRSAIVQDKDVVATNKAQKSLGHLKLKNGNPKIFEDFRNFNGYPIYVTVFASVMMNVTTNKDNETSYTMLDANVMNLIEKRLSSKFQLNVIDSEEEGDPFIKALDTLVDGESDIVFTAYFAKLYLRQFAFTTSIFEDRVCLIAPSSQPVPKYFMPLLPFSNELWFLMLLYNVVIAVLWLLIQRIELTFRRGCKVATAVPVDIKIRLLAYRRSNHSRCDQCIKQAKPLHLRFHCSRSYNEPKKIHPWIVSSVDLLTLACYPLSGGKTCTERAFLFGTLFFGLIVVGLYQSYLVSSLSKPIFYPELNTLSDVVESNRTIITKYKNLQQDTFAQGTPTSDKLHKKIKLYTSQEKTYDMVAYRGYVSIGRFSSFQLENLTTYYNKGTNKLLLHMVEECPRAYPLSYPSRLYSPYLKRIDNLLLRMQQSGLIYKWYGDMILHAKVQTAKSIPRRSDERVKLTLEHLSLTFLGLGIGLFCSTIVFLCELHYARKLRCSTSRKRSSTLPNQCRYYMYDSKLDPRKFFHNTISLFFANSASS